MTANEVVGPLKERLKESRKAREMAGVDKPNPKRDALIDKLNKMVEKKVILSDNIKLTNVKIEPKKSDIGLDLGM